MSGQNRSTAVMQRRKAGTARALDYFPTPPWATRALMEELAHLLGAEGVSGRARLAGMTAWEPACGALDMARAIGEYVAQVRASDVHDHAGLGVEIHDFLAPGAGPGDAADLIITNPPFALAQPFIERALPRAREAVAMLVRSAFLESESRWRALWRLHPPSHVLQFVERVPMFEGRLDAKGSTATSYCWLVWVKYSPLTLAGETRLQWIAPCRQRLERPSDYPAAEARPAPLLEGVF